MSNIFVIDDIFEDTPVSTLIGSMFYEVIILFKLDDQGTIFGQSDSSFYVYDR